MYHRHGIKQSVVYPCPTPKRWSTNRSCWRPTVAAWHTCYSRRQSMVVKPSLLHRSPTGSLTPVRTYARLRPPYASVTCQLRMIPTTSRPILEVYHLRELVALRSTRRGHRAPSATYLAPPHRVLTNSTAFILAGASIPRLMAVIMLGATLISGREGPLLRVELSSAMSWV